MPASVKVGLPIVKGSIMAAVLFAVDVPFVQALIIAAVSATLSGLFLVFATVYTVRHANAIESKVDDVKRAVGAAQREGDQ